MDAVFWIVSGEQYIAEARKSSASIARLAPYIHRVLFTPDVGAIPDPAFTHCILLPSRMYADWLLDVVSYLNGVLRTFLAMDVYRCVWLDSDTYACAPLSDLFELADRFDLSAAHAPGRKTGATVAHIPDSFPELNIGVMAMRNGPALIKFADRWYRNFSAHSDTYRNNDQASLRETLWSLPEEFRFRFAVLPPEFNCRPLGTGVYLKGPARILHIRHPEIERLALEVNQDVGMRIWKPT